MQIYFPLLFIFQNKTSQQPSILGPQATSFPNYKGLRHSCQAPSPLPYPGPLRHTEVTSEAGSSGSTKVYSSD